MNRKIEVVTVDARAAKLTLTKDRITMKIPKVTTLVDTERLIKYFKKVAEKHPSPETTLRDAQIPEKIFKYGLRLHTNTANGSKVIYYNHEFEE
mgnify:CR=1 FL=1